MRLANRDLIAVVLLALGLSAVWLGEPAGTVARAQNSSPQRPLTDTELDATLDPYQRTGQILYNKLMGKSGWERGQHLYYFKCWICHNDNTIKLDPQGAAPTLKGLYQRPKMITGEPVNHETVEAKIQNGGPRMPAYRHSMSDEELKDMVIYLREKCCWDENNPPRNPRYRY